MACLKLTLYLNYSFPRCVWANDVRTLSNLCRELTSNYSIDIVRVAEEPQRACRDGVFSTPTVLMELPDGDKTVLGNLVETKNFLRSRQLPRSSAEAKGLSLLSIFGAWKLIERAGSHLLSGRSTPQ